MQANSRDAVNFNFVATCGRKLCTVHTLRLLTRRADEQKNKSRSTAVTNTLFPRRTLTFKLSFSLRTREMSSIG